MTAQTEVAPQRQGTDDDELDHITECHDDNRGLCGADLTEAAWVEESLNLCVVCADLDGIHCGCECGCCDGGEAVCDQIRRETEQAIRNCPDCEGTHFVLDPDTKQPTRQRCNHDRALRRPA